MKLRVLVFSSSYLICLSFFLQSCSKKSDSSSSPAPSATLSTDLCVGDSGNDYFPLTKGNQTVVTAHPGGDRETYDVIKDSTMAWYGLTGAFKTFTQKNTSSISVNSPTYKYYRIADNGDVYSSTHSDGSYAVLVVPGSPTVGNYWLGNVDASNFRDSFVVSSTTSTLSLGSCNYGNVLVINRYSVQQGSPVYLRNKFFYKKGLGMLQYETYSNNTYIGNYSITGIKVY